MSRSRYVWHAFHKINVDIDIDKTENEDEAEEWKHRNMCKIGNVCDHDQCWGSDAEKCFNQEPTHWTESKEKDFFGKTKSVLLRHVCIMDWQCKISLMHRSIYPQNLITIHKDKKYYKEMGHILLIDKEITPTEKKKNLSCIRNEDSFHCRDILTTGSIYVVISDKDPCAGWASKEYCASERKQLTSKPTTDAILSDLVQVSSALRVITKDINYNTYQTKISLDHIKKDLYSLIKSLIPSNPHILSNILKFPSYSRITRQNIVEVCPCDPLPGCEEKQEHHHNFDSCPNTKISGNLTLFGDEALFLSLGDEEFEFQGADLNPSIDEMENQFYSDHIVKNGNKKDVSPSLFDYGIFGLKEWSLLFKGPSLNIDLFGSIFFCL